MSSEATGEPEYEHAHVAQPGTGYVEGERGGPEGDHGRTHVGLHHHETAGQAGHPEERSHFPE